MKIEIKSNKRYKKNKSRTKKVIVKPKRVYQRTSVDVGLGLPKRMVVTHKYSDSVSLVSTSGSLALANFCCNGMYDPNLAIGGGQPLYFGDMTGIYRHYHVIGSKLKVRFIPTSPSTPPGCVGVFINDDTATAGSSHLDLNEQTSSRYRYYTYNNDRPMVLTSNWSAKKTFGGSVLGNDELSGTATTNPVEQSVWTMYYQPIDLVSSGTVTVEVSIEYIAVWSEIRDVAF